jgi:hypothetical protein
MISPLALEYLEKAKQLLIENHHQIQCDLDDYFETPTTKKTVARYFELKKQGFELDESSEKIRKINKALEEIEHLIYFNSRRF